MDAVTLKHVDKSYTSYSTEVVLTGQTRESRTRQVLKDLSLSFPVGQLTVIVGRSGCGKSTLLKLLAGKEQPDAGEIAMPEGWHSAMLSPEPYVISWTNVQRNVAMACGVGKTPEERYEKARDFVRLVGLEDYADLTPVELSTGMKQRLGLARVLAGQAELLLMDEPFASLDFLTREELQTQLLGIQQKMPRTIILVTHQLDEAVLLGQKIIVMHSDSTVREFDLSGEPYPRDLSAPQMQQLKREITDECRKAQA
jgi:sulfonate transport system ATP-binding protein